MTSGESPISRIKYTPEILAEAAKTSTSVAGVLRNLGLQPAGGTHAYISQRLLYFNIDTSHFTRQAHNRGKISTQRRSASDILVKRTEGTRTRTLHLRRSLLEIGRTLECEECGIGEEWRGKPLTLEVDHIDGDWLNDLAENLRFLCPNCHSQCRETNRSWRKPA